MLERLNQAMEHIECHLDQRSRGRAGADRGDVGVPLPAAVLRARGDPVVGVHPAQAADGRGCRSAGRGADVARGRGALRVQLGRGVRACVPRMHGVGPGEVRRTGARLQSQPRMSFRLIVEGSSSMRYRVVEKDEFRLVGRKARVPLVHEGMNPAIVAFIRASTRRHCTASRACRTRSRGVIRRATTRRQPRRGHRTRLLPRGGDPRRRARGHGQAHCPGRGMGRLRELRAVPAGAPVPVEGRVHAVVPVQPVPSRPGRDLADPGVAGRDTGGRGAVDPRGAGRRLNPDADYGLQSGPPYSYSRLLCLRPRD